MKENFSNNIFLLFVEIILFKKGVRVLKKVSDTCGICDTVFDSHKWKVYR